MARDIAQAGDLWGVAGGVDVELEDAELAGREGIGGDAALEVIGAGGEVRGDGVEDVGLKGSLLDEPSEGAATVRGDGGAGGDDGFGEGEVDAGDLGEGDGGGGVDVEEGGLGAGGPEVKRSRTTARFSALMPEGTVTSEPWASLTVRDASRTAAGWERRVRDARRAAT